MPDIIKGRTFVSAELVTPAKLNAFIDAAVIADSAITEAKVAANAITNAKIADATITAAKLAVGAAMPPGSVMAFAHTAAPTGWLLCQGQAVSRTTYAALFAVLSTTWGEGDASTTFNLPDLRGEFVRGADDGRGIDAARAFASAQGDAIRNITGDFALRARAANLVGGDPFSISGAFTSNLAGAEGYPTVALETPNQKERIITFDASASGVPTAPENRPRNVAMHYIIKT